MEEEEALIWARNVWSKIQSKKQKNIREKNEDHQYGKSTRKKITDVVQSLRSALHSADTYDRLVKLVNIAAVHMGAREILDVDAWINVIRAADLDLDASDARSLYSWISTIENQKRVLGKTSILNFLRHTRYARSISRGVAVEVFVSDKWTEGTIATLLRSTAGGGYYDVSTKKSKGTIRNVPRFRIRLKNPHNLDENQDIHEMWTKSKKKMETKKEIREQRILQQILAGEEKKRNNNKLSKTSLKRLLSKFCILTASAVSNEAKWLSEKWIHTFEGQSCVRKREITLQREAERLGKNDDDGGERKDKARAKVLKERIKSESVRITKDVDFHMSLLQDYVDSPNSLSFEKWLQDRDANRKRDDSETREWSLKKRREIQKTRNLGRRFAVTEEIRTWIQGLYRQTIRERKMKDGKTTVCSCRDTLAGPMEIRRVLLQISRQDITTYSEFRKILGRVLFSMRATSKSVAEKIHNVCDGSSNDTAPSSEALFYKTRKEAESRLKTLKVKKRKEMRKKFKTWRRAKRKEARKLRVEKKKQDKKKEESKQQREKKSRDAYKKWCEMRKKGMYWSNVKKDTCEVPWEHNDEEHHGDEVVKKKKKKEAWVSEYDVVDVDDDDDDNEQQHNVPDDLVVVTEEEEKVAETLKNNVITVLNYYDEVDDSTSGGLANH